MVALQTFLAISCFYVDKNKLLQSV